MTTTQHATIKPEVLAATAVGLIDREITVPNTFTKLGIENFKGAKDDTINMKVDGVLPFHKYGWRNNRAAELIMDSYTERKIAVTFGDDAYSGVLLTDEQNDMDEIGWAGLLGKQVRAVGRGINDAAVDYLTGAAYAVTVGVSEDNMRPAFVEANRVLKRFNTPGKAVAMCGTSFAAAIENDPRITLAQYVGDENANRALTDSALGRLAGFSVIANTEIGENDCYIYVPGAFAFLNAAPAVPQSVPFGAAASFNGISLRWIRDYESMRLQDRSIVNTWFGFQTVTDVLRGIGADGIETVSAYEHFVRGIKLTLGGTSAYPLTVAAGGSLQSAELKLITGLSAPARLAEDYTATGWVAPV